MNHKPKKLLITTSTYPRWKGDSTPAFIEQFAYSIAAYFDDIYVLAPHAQGAQVRETAGNVHVKRYRYFYPYRMQDITYNGGGIYKIKKNILYAMKLLCLMTSLFFNTLWMVSTKKIDIINPHWVVPQGFVAVLVKFITGRKVILTVHGSDIFQLTGNIMTKIKRFILKHSDVVCVNSNATRRACEDIYQRDYVVIPMGVDTEVFKPIAKSSALVERYKLNSFTILFVGRLAEVKGIIYLGEALKLLNDDGCSFKAIIVGEGPSKQELEEYIKNNNLSSKVILPGWINQSELNEYYSVADVFVGPSLREAQGIVFVESLATGTPVIASDVGGVSDIVQDGNNGYLVSPKSSKEIYEKLKIMLDNPDVRDKFNANSRQSTLDNFSWDSVSKRYIDIFQHNERSQSEDS